MTYRSSNTRLAVSSNATIRLPCLHQFEHPPNTRQLLQNVHPVRARYTQCEGDRARSLGLCRCLSQSTASPRYKTPIDQSTRPLQRTAPAVSCITLYQPSAR